MASVADKLCKDVHDMSINGDQPPPEYVVEQSSFGSVDPSAPVGSFPLIDLSIFSSGSSLEVEAELEKLRSALSNSAGCFQVMELKSSFLDKVQRATKEFFALPMEEKMKYSRRESGNEGYGIDVEGYGIDDVVTDEQVLDWSHRLILKVFPKDHQKLHLWPDDLREILDEYVIKLRPLMDNLYKAMARSLHLEETSFSNQFGDRSLIYTRLNFYPPCSRPDLVLGVKAHTDGSVITVLQQDDEVEGLQILQDGNWVRVPVIPHALLINIGDQMQIMSNGIFRSPLHKVVTNTEKMRMSMAFFHHPEPGKEIGPMDGLVDEKRPRVYRNVKNYGNINYECYQKGIVALDTVKL